MTHVALTEFFFTDHTPWIQVEYKVEKKVFGVVTQGRSTSTSYVTTYQVSYKKLNSNEFVEIVDASGKAEVRIVFLNLL